MTEFRPSLDSNNPFERLAAIMEQLRAPVGGCPWDIEQSFETIAPYTIEEAYEVADAIERRDTDCLKEELGDLLFQVAFHSQMASEAGYFNLSDVANGISDKMLRRHPHVFETPDKRTSKSQSIAWETMKAKERELKSPRNESTSALQGVALALPSLLRAEKLQKRAARVGFDWTEPKQIFSKLAEETLEVEQAIEHGSPEEIEEEIGDLLFVVANLARRLNVNPETALRKANAKFERRFRAMESLSSERGEVFSELNLDAQEALWVAVKKNEV